MHQASWRSGDTRLALELYSVVRAHKVKNAKVAARSPVAKAALEKERHRQLVQQYHRTEHTVAPERRDDGQGALTAAALAARDGIDFTWADVGGAPSLRSALSSDEVFSTAAPRGAEGCVARRWECDAGNSDFAAAVGPARPVAVTPANAHDGGVPSSAGPVEARARDLAAATWRGTAEWTYAEARRCARALTHTAPAVDRDADPVALHRALMDAVVAEEAGVSRRRMVASAIALQPSDAPCFPAPVGLPASGGASQAVKKRSKSSTQAPKLKEPSTAAGRRRQMAAIIRHRPRPPAFGVAARGSPQRATNPASPVATTGVLRQLMGRLPGGGWADDASSSDDDKGPLLSVTSTALVPVVASEEGGAPPGCCPGCPEDPATDMKHRRDILEGRAPGFCGLAASVPRVRALHSVDPATLTLETAVAEDGELPELYACPEWLAGAGTDDDEEEEEVEEDDVAIWDDGYEDDDDDDVDDYGYDDELYTDTDASASVIAVGPPVAGSAQCDSGRGSSARFQISAVGVAVAPGPGRRPSVPDVGPRTATPVEPAGPTMVSASIVPQLRPEDGAAVTTVATVPAPAVLPTDSMQRLLLQCGLAHTTTADLSVHQIARALGKQLSRLPQVPEAAGWEDTAVMLGAAPSSPEALSAALAPCPPSDDASPDSATRAASAAVAAALASPTEDPGAAEDHGAVSFRLLHLAAKAAEAAAPVSLAMELDLHLLRYLEGAPEEVRGRLAPPPGCRCHLTGAILVRPVAAGGDITTRNVDDGPDAAECSSDGCCFVVEYAQWAAVHLAKANTEHDDEAVWTACLACPVPQPLPALGAAVWQWRRGVVAEVQVDAEARAALRHEAHVAVLGCVERAAVLSERGVDTTDEQRPTGARRRAGSSAVALLTEQVEAAEATIADSTIEDSPEAKRAARVARATAVLRGGQPRLDLLEAVLRGAPAELPRDLSWRKHLRGWLMAEATVAQLYLPRDDEIVDKDLGVVEKLLAVGLEAAVRLESDVYRFKAEARRTVSAAAAALPLYGPGESTTTWTEAVGRVLEGEGNEGLAPLAQRPDRHPAAEIWGALAPPDSHEAPPSLTTALCALYHQLHSVWAALHALQARHAALLRRRRLSAAHASRVNALLSLYSAVCDAAAADYGRRMAESYQAIGSLLHNLTLGGVSSQSHPDELALAARFLRCKVGDIFMSFSMFQSVVEVGLRRCNATRAVWNARDPRHMDIDPATNDDSVIAALTDPDQALPPPLALPADLPPLTPLVSRLAQLRVELVAAAQEALARGREDQGDDVAEAAMAFAGCRTLDDVNAVYGALRPGAEKRRALDSRTAKATDALRSSRPKAQNVNVPFWRRPRPTLPQLTEGVGSGEAKAERTKTGALPLTVGLSAVAPPKGRKPRVLLGKSAAIGGRHVAKFAGSHK